MKLIRMHVDNFGCLHDFDYSFNDGLNVVLHDNGWGKTTMAVFMKAMLYGFGTKRSKDINENERKRYLPWQGGKYGGTLEFEADGARFCITRTFGETPRFDRIKIVDMDKHTTARIDPDKIGDTLFRLDEKAFQRSVFINQNGFTVDGASSSIHSRLNALVSQANDVAAFDDAIASLTAQVKIYEKTGMRGKIGDITRQIAALEKEKSQIELQIRNQDEARERISQIDKMLSVIGRDIEEKKARLESVSGENKKREAAKKMLEDINRQIKEIEEQLTLIRSELGGKVPSSSEIDDIKRERQMIAQLSARMKELEADHGRFTSEYQSLLEKYNGTLPTAVQLDEIQKLNGELRGVTSSEDDEKNAVGETPQGYEMIEQIVSEDGEYVSKLKAAVDSQKDIQELMRRSELQELDIRRKREQWAEKTKRYASLTKDTEQAKQLVDEQNKYAPKIVQPVIQSLEKQQKTISVLSTQKQDIVRNIQRETQEWEDKTKAYTVLVRETGQVRKELDEQKQYAPEKIDPLISSLEQSEKNRVRLERKSKEYEETIRCEADEWTRKKKRFEELRSAAESLSAEDKTNIQRYSAENVEPIINMLEDIQRRQQVVDLKRDSISGAALTPEQERLLNDTEGTLADPEEGRDILKRFRNTEQSRSELKGSYARLEGEKSRRESIKASIDQLDAVVETITPVPEPKKSIGSAMIGIGGGIGVLGIVLIFIVSPFMAAAAVLGAGLVVFGVVSNKNHSARVKSYEAYQAAKSRMEEAAVRKAELQSQYNAACESVSSFEKQIAETEKNIRAEEAVVNGWVSKWSQEKASESVINGIIEKAEEVRRLSRKRQEVVDIQRFIESETATIKKERESADRSFSEISGKTTADALSYLRHMETEYRIKTEQHQAAINRYETFLGEEKLSPSGLSMDVSPNTVFLKKQLGKTNEELSESIVKQRSLIAVYPEFSGLSYDAIINLLRERVNAYRVAESQLRAAERNEERFVKNAKVSKEQLTRPESPLIDGYSKKLVEIESELKEISRLREENEALYPEIKGMTYDDALALLRGKLSNYRVYENQYNMAVNNQNSFVSQLGVKPDELLLTDPPRIKESEDANAAAEESLRLIIENDNRVLGLLGMTITPESAADELKKAGALLSEYMTHKEKLRISVERSQKRQQQINDLQQSLNDRLVVLRGRYSELELNERLVLVREQVAQAGRLREKISELKSDLSREQVKLDKAKHKVSLFMDRHTKFIPETDDPFVEICTMVSNDSKLRASIVPLEEQRRSILEAERNVSSQVSEKEKELREQIAALEERKDKLLVEYTQKNDFIRQADASLSKYPDVLTELGKLYDQKQKAGNDLSVLKKTISLITKAKENLADRYLSRVEQLFNSYMQLWLGNDTVRGILDIDFNITIEENDKTHIAEGYSTGYCDLIDFCMRLALVDTLFENEQPFLILDDPFVNLDADRLEKAIELLQLMSGSKQIIYFVCHPIRAAETEENAVSKETFTKLAQKARKNLEEKKTASDTSRKTVQRSPKDMYKVVSVCDIPFRPAKPGYTITNSIFSMEFIPNEAAVRKDMSFELFFIDAKGHVLNDRQLLEFKDGRLTVGKVRFCLNTRDDSGDVYELMIRESTQDDYEVVQRIPFRVKLAFVGTDNFDF